MDWQRVLFNSSYINGLGVFLILTFQKNTTFSRETKTKNVFWTRAFVAWADGDGSKGEVQNKFCYILQNKNQKNYWVARAPRALTVDKPLFCKN